MTRPCWHGSGRGRWATGQCRRAEPQTTWQAHYRARLGEQAAFDDRIFDPAGLGPPIWFQEVPETKAGKNRLHLDLYPTGRDMALPLERRIEIVEATVAEHAGLGRRAWSSAPGTTTPMTLCTTSSYTTPKPTNSASAEPPPVN
jgi:hypothetical protein